MSDKIADLEKKRNGIQKRLVKLQATVVGWDKATVKSGDVEVVNNNVIDIKKKISDLYDRTDMLCSDDEFDTHEADFDTLFGCLDRMEITLIDVKDHLAKAQPHVFSAFKLERIKLQPFSGVLSEWLSFKDLFESSVHKNTTLSGTEKWST